MKRRLTFPNCPAARAMALVACISGAVSVGIAQEFANLDFELGQTPPDRKWYYTDAAQRTMLLPGWETFHIVDVPEAYSPYRVFRPGGSSALFRSRN